MEQAFMERWVSVHDELPKAGKKVLTVYNDPDGHKRTILARYIPRWTIEVECCEYSELYDDYCEEKDAFFYKEGWYEHVYNWDDFTSFVPDGRITHWMPLPRLPK
jgi:hypothetical protein